MMTELDKAFSWTYNIFDAEKFRKIAAGENIDFKIDYVDGKLVPDLERVVMDRVALLKNGKPIEMSFADDVASYNVTRLIASICTSGKQWYASREAALFKLRMGGMHDAIGAINYFFGTEIARELTPAERRVAELSKLKNPVNVKWQFFSTLLKTRKYSVKGGWICAPLDLIKDIIASKYKKSLENRLKKDWKSLQDGSELLGILGQYITLLDEVAPARDTPIPESTEITYIIALSPLCIRELDYDIQRGVDIGYEAYIRLSFYLKTFLDLESLRQYFYTRNPLNARAFSSVDQYINSIPNLDYAIKYWYGESGSTKSYNSYACEKFATVGLCPFMYGKTIERVVTRHDGEVLSLLDDHARQVVLAKITGLSAKKWRSWACGSEFCARFSFEPTERVKINYPVVYFNKGVEITRSRHEQPAEDPSLESPTEPS